MGWQNSSGGSGRGFRHSSWVVENDVIAIASRCESPCDAIRSWSPVSRYRGVEAVLGRATPRTNGRLRRAERGGGVPPQNDQLMSQSDQLKLERCAAATRNQVG
jgi:hypothetical protein